MRKMGWGLFVPMAAALAAFGAHEARADGAACPPNPKQVMLSVQEYEVGFEDYAKAAQGVPAGGDHDRLLLAALVKSGARALAAPRILTTDGVKASIVMTQDGSAASADGHDQAPKVTDRFDATPHCNTDGTIGVEMKMELTTAAPGPPPATTVNAVSSTRAIRDGETCLLGAWTPLTGDDMKMRLFSLTAAIVPDKPSIVTPQQTKLVDKAAPAAKPVVLSVQFVDVAPADYTKIAGDIPMGADHDALLLAALMKSGAKPAPAPLTERVPGRVLTSADIHYDMADGKQGTLTLVTSVDATAVRNADGTISGSVHIHREVPIPGAAAGAVPTTTTTDVTTNRTLPDGETHLLEGFAPTNGADPISHLAFLKMTSVDGKP